jgi:hypothetical protein
VAATGGGHELNPALLQQQHHHHHAPRSLLLFSMREGPAIAGGASAVGAAACYPRGSPWSPLLYRVAGGAQLRFECDERCPNVRRSQHAPLRCWTDPSQSQIYNQRRRVRRIQRPTNPDYHQNRGS